MVDTTFTDYVTPVPATWLNEVNDHVHSSTPVSPATTVHPASVIANTPSGTIAATTVQAAIDELNAEKAALAGSASQAFSALTLTSAGTVSGAASTGTGISSAVVGLASTSGYGMYGRSNTGTGVRGDSLTSGYGVYGSSPEYGVYGSGNMYGVAGVGAAVGAIGVSGHSSGGHGVVASGLVASPTKSAFQIIPQNAEPTGPNEVGDIYVTTAGVLKICTVAGTPGTYVSVGSQV